MTTQPPADLHPQVVQARIAALQAAVHVFTARGGPVETALLLRRAQSYERYILTGESEEEG